VEVRLGFPPCGGALFLNQITMKTIIAILLLLPATAFSQEKLNYIEVRGQAVVKVVPDQIYLRIRIAEKQKNRVDMDVKEKKMLEAFTKIGIDRKDIVIKDLASNFRSALFTDDNIILTKEFVVCVHEGKTANKIISELEALEISNIRIDHLDHTKLTDFKRDCGIQAMVAAKSKAEALTHSINQSIGKALYIEELQNPHPARAEYNNVVYKAEATTSPDWFVSDLAFDEIRIECTILARFELIEGSHN
jgi:uncharacterized protein